MWPRWPGLFAVAGTLTAASIAGSATTFLGSLPWGGLHAPTSRSEMQTVQYRLPGPSLWCEGWGLGWSIIDSSLGLVGHMGGSSTFMLGSVEMGKVAFFLSNTANGAPIGRDLVLRALGLNETRILPNFAASNAEAIPAARFQGRCGTAAFFVEVSASADDPTKVLGKPRLDRGDPIALEKLLDSTFTGKLMSFLAELNFMLGPDGTDVKYLHVGFRALTRITEN
ncbi:hypothetical protein BKA56DRAFT_619026 [Ilyonectria sp. MPI-CAGE-AT-0026]|nr:hypothetical protein BKA56DRAFT_619026 [Ilyonectria sp. MPI-CAGE-AT-0026]